MPRTPADALENIDAKRDALAANLVTKGVTVANTETMKDLIAKVLDVPAGTDTSDATAVAADISAGKTAYVAAGKVTGTQTGIIILGSADYTYIFIQPTDIIIGEATV